MGYDIPFTWHYPELRSGNGGRGIFVLYSCCHASERATFLTYPQFVQPSVDGIPDIEDGRVGRRPWSLIGLFTTRIHERGLAPLATGTKPS